MSTSHHSCVGTHWPLNANGSRHKQQGSVLIAVLAIILILSFLIISFVDEASQDMEYQAMYNESPEIRSFAYSMLEVTLATVQEVALIDDGKLYAPEQGWSDPLSYSGIAVPNGWSVQIDIQDESSKLPINTMSENQLNQMLEESFGFDFGTARELSSMLQDWIDTDNNRRLNGAESDEYLNRNPPYKAADAPLQSLDELRLLEVWEDEFFDEDGAANELFTKLESMVSVIHSSPVNLNTTSPDVMEYLALEGGFDEKVLFDSLNDVPYLEEKPSSVAGDVSSVEITLLRITVSLLRGNSPFTISALVEPNFEANEGGSNAPGSSSDDSPKTGALSEQDEISYPFSILQISEYSQGSPAPDSARYSALDIDQESDSFN